MSSVQTEFGVHSDFLESLMILAKKGGPGQRAADRVMKAYDKAIKANASFDDVFEGIPLTNHGEGRINNCRKFDLTGFARLVTTYNRNVCIFLFAGTHDDVDRWLQKNRGLDFIGRSEGKTIRLSPVYVSDVKNQDVGFIDSNIDLQSEGPIIDLLDEKDKNQLLAGLSLSLCGELKTITSITSDDQILKLLSTIEPGRQCDAIFDVLIDLRASDKVKAKNRIDQYSGVAKLLAEIPDKALTEVVSSESIVMVQDIDPVLFQHFVRTANFKQWMLYLHPAQRSIVERRFEGSARLAGVSGSGKTCVVVHRAVRLARADESKSVLIITLNDALSKLISDLVIAQCGALQPKNIQIKSIFQLCAEHLAQLEPDKKDYYTRRTTVKNQFASSEHIDEIWREYFHCEANNRSADVMMDLVKTLAVRGVCSQDYIRQELDYVRSAFSEDERKKYLDMERTGRVVPLTKPYRKSILAGLDGWEKKMSAVGAVDDLGIVTALNKHIDKLKPHFHHTLVDEVQDLGTLELEIIRKLTHTGADDLFLCGDAAQSVQTKHADFKLAGVAISAKNSISLKQNYRNSSQILSAAYDVLTKSFEKIPSGTVDIEILPPEYANFSSPNPALLKADTFKQELGLALAYVDEVTPKDSGKKACISLCGFTQKAVEELSRDLSIPVLSDTSDISSGHLFLSDLEQTKGFEFDLMIILNCSEGIVPHPQLPEAEWFRDLSKLYVALTRAKTELVVSYSGNHSVFLAESLNRFNVGPWSDYGLTPNALKDLVIPAPALEKVGDASKWDVIGNDFLKLRDAIGLSPSAQDATIQCATGRERTEGRAGGKRKQLEWKTFKDFMAAMQNPQNAVSLISKEVLSELNDRYGAYVKPQRSSVPVLVAKTQPEETKVIALEKPAVKDVAGTTLYKHPKSANFKYDTHSAYMLAVFLVAQKVANVDQLEVGKSMSVDAINFLLSHRPIEAWIQNKWLRPHKTYASYLVLTRPGVDECLARVIDFNNKGRASSPNLRVTKDRVEAFRLTILNGPGDVAMSQGHNYVEKTFKDL